MGEANRAGFTTYTTPSDTEFVAVRVFDAPRALVWDVWNSPEHAPHWLLGPEGWTMPVCEVDLRPGGVWRMVWRQADGTEMEMKGVYREVVPPERVVRTEVWGPGWAETINAVAFSETDGKTTVTITVTYPSKEARDAAMATGMTRGMDMSFARADEYLRTLA